MMEANAHTAGNVYLDVLDEDLQRVVLRHGGERVSQRGTVVTAGDCHTLQHTATHYSILQHTAAHCNTLQHSATP